MANALDLKHGNKQNKPIHSTTWKLTIVNQKMVHALDLQHGNKQKKPICSTTREPTMNVRLKKHSHSTTGQLIMTFW